MLIPVGDKRVHFNVIPEGMSVDTFIERSNAGAQRDNPSLGGGLQSFNLMTAPYVRASHVGALNSETCYVIKNGHPHKATCYVHKGDIILHEDMVAASRVSSAFGGPVAPKGSEGRIFVVRGGKLYASALRSAFSEGLEKITSGSLGLSGDDQDLVAFLASTPDAPRSGRLALQSFASNALAWRSYGIGGAEMQFSDAMTLFSDLLASIDLNAIASQKVQLSNVEYDIPGAVAVLVGKSPNYYTRAEGLILEDFFEERLFEKTNTGRSNSVLAAYIEGGTYERTGAQVNIKNTNGTSGHFNVGQVSESGQVRIDVLRTDVLEAVRNATYHLFATGSTEQAEHVTGLRAFHKGAVAYQVS